MLFTLTLTLNSRTNLTSTSSLSVYLLTNETESTVMLFEQILVVLFQCATSTIIATIYISPTASSLSQSLLHALLSNLLLLLLLLCYMSLNLLLYKQAPKKEANKR